MPTPDTETLAARLRAVERALTDDETVLDPAELDRGTEDDRPDPDDGAPPDAVVSPDADIERRVRDLEAAVQALRGALDAVDATDARDAVGERSAAEPDHAPTAVDGGESPAGPDRPAGGDAWPDDLAAGGE